MKTLFSLVMGLLVFAGVAVCPASAQETIRLSKPVAAGVMNGKATSLPKPEYPAELKAAGIEGTVVVNVVIAEDGSVVSAEAEIYDQRVKKTDDGTVLEPSILDSQLRTSAENAAKNAKFSPTLLSNVPVAVKGKLVYNFVAKTSADVGGSPRVISGGVLNGKAAELPMPVYPAAAKAVAAGGSVSVEVTVNEEGQVISASAVSGHPLLRSAAETAARSARFAPTLLNGNGVQILGVLTYNFVP